MAYQVVVKRTDPKTQVVTITPAVPFGYGDGPVELRDYTNGASDKPDPQVFWPSGRWIHLSTLRHWGYEVQDMDTGEIVEIADLSECCEGHARLRAEQAARGGQHAG